jgi:DNA-binding protein HU-beta
MTKKDLVNAVSERSGVDRIVVENVLNSTLNEAKKAVVDGKNIYIRGFGSIGPKLRKQKVGQDIRLGQPVVIPPHKIPSFKPSRVFRYEVNLGKIMKANEF